VVLSVQVGLAVLAVLVAQVVSQAQVAQVDTLAQVVQVAKVVIVAQVASLVPLRQHLDMPFSQTAQLDYTAVVRHSWVYPLVAVPDCSSPTQKANSYMT